MLLYLGRYFWRFNLLFFAIAMFFGLVANAAAFLVLEGMETLGWSRTGWVGRDFQMYAAYWRIAPQKGWSRVAHLLVPVAFVLAAAFLFRSALWLR